MMHVILADFNTGREYIVKNNLDPKKTIIVTGKPNLIQMHKIKAGEGILHKVNVNKLDSALVQQVMAVARQRMFQIK